LTVGVMALVLPNSWNKSSSNIPVNFQCPTEFTKAENDDPSMKQEYVEVTQQITNNMTEFLRTFREENFDGWTHTYDEVKEGLRPFKAKYYPPNLESGDTIFESACGIGLNLFMTLEILYEEKGITDIVVYGNEYLKVSAAKANAVVDRVAPHDGKKGVICAADSTNLSFVPGDAFDLVYTGYIRYVGSAHSELLGIRFFVRSPSISYTESIVH
jgi:hypothetical protein